jgi:hypothetical protein
LLRTRFQKAIAEGASTSQVTAISVLASIYLQAVIAASMEEVEMFLAPLTARSKVREVLRGLVATRQVHTLSLGHAPHFYVAGTLPEFATAPTLYTSSSMPASAYFLQSREHDEEALDIEAPKPVTPILPAPVVAAKMPVAAKPMEPRKSSSNGSSAAPRPHFTRPAAHSRDRKPAQGSSGRPSKGPNSRTGSRTSAHPATRSVRRAGSTEVRPSAARPAGGRWNPKAPASINGTRNGAHKTTGSSNGSRTNGTAGARTTKSSASAWSQRNGHASGAKTSSKPSTNGRSSVVRSGTVSRKDVRPDARPARNNRKPALAASNKAGNNKRFGFAARPKQETKKRG